MGLPSARNTTYGGGSPVKSADLNDMQDNFVGAKHPALTIPLYGFEWKSSSPAGGGVTFADATGKWTWAGFDNITAGLRVPVGTRITGARFNYNRTGGTLNFKIQKRLAGAGAWTDIVTGSDNATAGAGVKVLACTETVVADTAYRLYMDSSGVATTDVSSYTIDRL